MFSVTPAPGPIPTLALEDSAAGSRAVLAPARGGLLTSLVLGGRELLYLDEVTFRDPAANVRGGNPVLFPTPGKLAGDSWERDGARGSLKQHGFARNLPWEVAATGTDLGACATLRLEATEATLARYPWDFAAEYAYRLSGRELAIDMRFDNRSDRPMPFGAGFHPYLAVPDAEKVRVRIATKATRAFDNAAKREVGFTGFDLTAAEVDLHLLDHGGAESSLALGDATIAVRASPDFTHWVVWTLKGKDFLCLEPWTCPGNALNTGERLLWLAPGADHRMWVRLSLEG